MMRGWDAELESAEAEIHGTLAERREQLLCRSGIPFATEWLRTVACDALELTPGHDEYREDLDTIAANISITTENERI